MRELQIVSTDVEKSFSDIDELTAYCKFSDWRHETEPGCAVRKAIENVDFDEARLENYKKINKELRYKDLNSRSLEKEKINNIFGRIVSNKNRVILYHSIFLFIFIRIT